MATHGETQIVQVREAYPPQARRDPGLAVVLELLPGIMLQTFGIGNIYAGNVAGGILMMIGYWVSMVINVILCLVVVGFVTLPLTWVLFMVFCPIAAHRRAQRTWGS